MGTEKEKEELLEFLESELEEIKSKHKSREKREEEIDCVLINAIASEIFKRELEDKELDIFIATYHHILYYAPVIEEILSKL